MEYHAFLGLMVATISCGTRKRYWARELLRCILLGESKWTITEPGPGKRITVMEFHAVLRLIMATSGWMKKITGLENVFILSCWGDLNDQIWGKRSPSWNFTPFCVWFSLLIGRTRKSYWASERLRYILYFTPIWRPARLNDMFSRPSKEKWR